MLVGTVCQPLEGEAANKGVQQWLEPGKTYSYNLDQTGKKEKIKYEKTYNEKKDGTYSTTVKIYINGKVVYSYTKPDVHDDDPHLWVVDANEKDKQMEIFIISGFSDRSVTDKDILYLSYSKNKMKKIQDLYEVAQQKYKNWDAWYSEGIEYYGNDAYFGMDGKGNLDVCIAQYVGEPGWVNFIDTFTLKNSKFVISKKKNLDMMNYEGFQNVKVTKKGYLYKDVSCKKKAYSYKKGDKLNIYQVMLQKDGSVVLKAKDSKGHSGYVRLKDLPKDVLNVYMVD